MAGASELHAGARLWGRQRVTGDWTPKVQSTPRPRPIYDSASSGCLHIISHAFVVDPFAR